MSGNAVARRAHKPKAARLLEAQRCLELHASGVEDVHICEELGISRATLYRRMEWARSVILDPLVEEYRSDAAIRIREARRRVYRTLEQTKPYTETMLTENGIAVVPVLMPDGSPVMVPACTPTEIASLTAALVRLEDTEAKLRGGYAPTQVNVKHEVADAWAALEAELTAAQTRTTPADQETHA